VWYNKEGANANNVRSCTAKHYRHMPVWQQSELQRIIDKFIELAVDKLNI